MMRSGSRKRAWIHAGDVQDEDDRAEVLGKELRLACGGSRYLEPTHEHLKVIHTPGRSRHRAAIVPPCQLIWAT